MSAFLGPIHYWLYNKIKIQQSLVEDIITLSQEINAIEIDLKNELDARYGVSETRPLEEAIDKGNIHGWLQTCVSQAEYKLAYGVTLLLKSNPELLKNIEELFQNKGKEQSLSQSTNNASEIYKAISDSLLDGMPCDHANSVLEENEARVIWKRNTCVHKDYWDEVGGDINNYYILREAFIKGFLSSLPVKFIKTNEVTSMIERVDINE
ncbi:MAG: hypothetical protein H7Y18_14475 [Clostridiaceae bacterium]|nr:hypothetical protein [Clostridiaceae bacterium]